MWLAAASRAEVTDVRSPPATAEGMLLIEGRAPGLWGEFFVRAPIRPRAVTTAIAKTANRITALRILYHPINRTSPDSPRANRSGRGPIHNLVNLAARRTNVAKRCLSRDPEFGGRDSTDHVDHAAAGVRAGRTRNTPSRRRGCAVHDDGSIKSRLPLVLLRKR